MLTVRVLGEQSLADTVTGARGRSARALALVAYLAWHAGVPQPRGLMAELFWPDSTSAQAMTNLRRELHALRRIVPAEALAVTASSLAWCDSPGCDVDLRTFAREREAALRPGATPAVVRRHARVAVAAYGGDLLPGLDEPWADAAREELRAQCLELLDRLAGAASAVEDVPGALDAARRAVAMAPLEESRYLTLMRLQSAAGDRAAAIETYRRCRALLERELGVRPAPALAVELRRLLAAGDPDAPIEGGAPAPDRTVGAHLGVPLVGRTAEVTALVAGWQQATTGRGPSVAVVRGRPGLGKTRLAEEVEAVARAQGAVVAASSCFGTAGRVALAPVADWLRSSGVRAATASLDDVWRAEVLRLLPEDGATLPPSERPMADAWQRHRFFEGLAHALFAVRRPTLLVLDDLQWTDEETLAFVSLLLRLAAGRPLMLLTTVREDFPPPVAEWLAQLPSTGLSLTVVTLEPLARPESSALARALAGGDVDPTTLDALVSVSGGYPLFLREAVRSGIDAGAAATGWHDVLTMRLRQLSPAAQEVAALAAAVGRGFGLDLVADAAGRDGGPGPEAVVHAVDELSQAGILVEADGGYDFSHDLLREAAYAGVSPARKWLLHNRLALALERAGPEDPAVGVQLADQYARAGRPEQALPHYARAAKSAADRFAHAESVRLCHQALALVATLPPGDVRDAHELAFLRAEAAPLNAMQGYSSRALQGVLEQVVRLAESSGHTTDLAEGLLGLWSCRFVQGDVERSYEFAQRALATGGDQRLVAEAYFAAAGTAMTLGRLAESLDRFAQAERLSPGNGFLLVGTQPDRHRLAWQAHAQLLLGDPQGAVVSRTAAIDQSREDGHPYTLAVALAYAAVTDQIRGDRDALADTAVELLEVTTRYEFAYYGEWGHVLHGWLIGGEAGTAEARRGIATLRHQGSLVRMPYWLSLLADLHAAAGRDEAEVAALDAARALAGARGDRWWLPEILHRLAVVRGDERARAAAERLATEQGNRLLLDRLTTVPGPRGGGSALRTRRTLGERSRS
ncbi:ATP-binding protein [Nocardioides cheoyonin]|uniref:ATP-binding protein n=1 Tax=Nocardioides cheoyonin TaxID=3156615 RepID=UPI0032B5A55B